MLRKGFWSWLPDANLRNWIWMIGLGVICYYLGGYTKESQLPCLVVEEPFRELSNLKAGQVSELDFSLTNLGSRPRFLVGADNL